jgi:hypothetical protein
MGLDGKSSATAVEENADNAKHAATATEDIDLKPDNIRNPLS